MGKCVQTLRFVLAPRKIKLQQPLGHYLEEKTEDTVILETAVAPSLVGAAAQARQSVRGRTAKAARHKSCKRSSALQSDVPGVPAFRKGSRHSKRNARLIPCG